MKKIWKMQRKSKLNSEMIWTIWKKSKLTGKKIGKIWKKIVRRFGKYGKKDKLNSGMMEERQVEM